MRFVIALAYDSHCSVAKATPKFDRIWDSTGEARKFPNIESEDVRCINTVFFS